mgnify:CR=1 FL=1
MFDNHYTPNNYGIIRNFNISGNEVSTYTFFVMLALIVGLVFYLLTVEKDIEKKKNNGVAIAFAGLIGGLIGSKIPVMIENRDLLIDNIANIKYFIFTGKSIIGGLIGGFIGIKLLKSFLHISDLKFGNQLAPAIALGMALGLIGCFLSGCGYGIKTNITMIRDTPKDILGLSVYQIISLIIIIFILYVMKKGKKDGK